MVPPRNSPKYGRCKSVPEEVEDEHDGDEADPLLNNLDEKDDDDKDSQLLYGQSYSIGLNDTRSYSSISSKRSLPDDFIAQLPTPNKTSWLASFLERFDRDAVYFGIRMAVCITTSALFTLVQTDETKYPEALWVLITVLFVCWFPSLDAASVVEKSLQRVYGTMIGSAAALVCGFASLPFESKSNQAVFLGTFIWLYTFIICWAAVHYKVKGTKAKVISKYNYATILALLTFYISIMPFYTLDDPKNKRWIKAMYRILNVLVGCVLGAVLSVAILPRSTVSILQKKIENQIKLAGEASQCVLHIAADTFSNSACVSVGPSHESYRKTSIRRALSVKRRHWRRSDTGTETILGNEAALNKHEAAIQESRLIKAQLNMLKYDPFQFGTPDEVLVSFRTEVAHTLDRALRIQHTVVLLDGIIRNDPTHDFSETHINLFAEIGSLCQKMLSSPLCSQSARTLKEKMVLVRGYIIELSSKVSQTSDAVPAVPSRHDLAGMWDEDDEDNSEAVDIEGNSLDLEMDKTADASRLHVLLFLQLVEHLAFRSVRLYESWKFCQHLCVAVERRDNTNRASLLQLKDYYHSFRVSR